MNVITPAESDSIHAEITEQVFVLDDLMSRFKSPWGEASRRRIRRIIQKRMTVVFLAQETK